MQVSYNQQVSSFYNNLGDIDSGNRQRENVRSDMKPSHDEESKKPQETILACYHK
jgi:hypothetical protein